MKARATGYSISIVMLLAAACGSEPDELAAPGQQPVQRVAKAPPLVGGTLLVTRDGGYAVVSDPPRDSIHIVDLRSWKETGTIELEDGAMPFRGVEDDSGQVHVTLRGTGELVSIDPVSATLTSATHVCPNPRGVGFNETEGSLVVACAGGQLVTLPQSGRQPTRRFIAPDLRDVFTSEGRVFVTRFRAAEVLEVEQDGWSLFGAPVSLASGASSREPTTAWRTLGRPEGGWIMLHQSASTDPVPGFDEPPASDSDDHHEHDDHHGSGYTGTDPCSAAVNTTISATAEDGIVLNAGLLGRVALSVDVALSPDGERVAIATPTQQDLSDERMRVSVLEVQLDNFSADPQARCRMPESLAMNLHDDVVAVAYQPDGPLLAQARNEPVLYRMHEGNTQKLTLNGTDASDTGFELFHNDAGQGVSCASCHPEGGQDGRTWVFEDIGPRRTQALDVGLRGTAPFHWSGDMEDIHMIARQVRQGAMGGILQSEERQAAMRDWMFALRPPNPRRSPSDPSVANGAQLFASLGCVGCHAGESFTSPASVDLGLGPLQTPALRGVALRSPFMHDGRASTLEEAVVDMIDTTVVDARVAADVDGKQIASLVAYLESL